MKTILSDPELTIASIAVLIAVFSIIIGTLSLNVQRRHNRKTVKPISNLMFSDYENHIAVNIKNAGVGPLIIKSFTVKNKLGQAKKNIIDWMPDHPNNLPWSSFFVNLTGVVIPAGDSLNIISLKTDQSITQTFAEFRNKVRKALSELEIELSYMDVYERKLPTNKKDLKWFGRNIT